MRGQPVVHTRVWMSVQRDGAQFCHIASHAHPFYSCAKLLSTFLPQIIKQERPQKGAGGKVNGGGRGGGNRSSKPYARGGKGGPKACNNCGVIGHLAGQCPEPSQCHACGSTAHAVAECPHKDKTCTLCGKVGHLKAKCRALSN